MKIIKYFFLIFLLLFSSQGNSIIYPTPLNFQLILGFFALFIYIQRNGSFPSKILFPLFIILLLQGIAAVKFGRFNLGFPSQVFYALITITLLKEDFIKYYIKVIYIMSIISLIFYIIFILDFNLLFNTMKSIQNSFDKEKLIYDGNYYSNIFIYTINYTEGLKKNCGFMWEPGPFSIMLSLALYFNLIYKNFKIEIISIALLITILTTFSTTGYLCLIVILIYFSLNKKEKLSLAIYLPISIITAVFLFSLPFMFEKITTQSDTNLFDVFSDLRNNKEVSKNRSIGRFAGLLLNIEDFKQEPIFGIGSVNNSIAVKEYGNVFSINGLGALLARYGIIGIIIFISLQYKLHKMIKTKYRIKFASSFLILIIIQTFAFGLIFSSLYLCFMFLYIIPQRKISKLSQIN